MSELAPGPPFILRRSQEFTCNKRLSTVRNRGKSCGQTGLPQHKWLGLSIAVCLLEVIVELLCAVCYIDESAVVFRRQLALPTWQHEF
eukprot:COSAG02_NODE_30747_length_546_cov_0.751678_1_plen_87_part_10